MVLATACLAVVFCGFRRRVGGEDLEFLAGQCRKKELRVVLRGEGSFHFARARNHVVCVLGGDVVHLVFGAAKNPAWAE